MRVVKLIETLTGIAVGALLTSGPYADDLQVPNVILQGLATGMPKNGALNDLEISNFFFFS
jgi:hypothetical protein